MILHVIVGIIESVYSFRLFVCAKFCVTIERNFLSRFVIHNNHSLLGPDGEQYVRTSSYKDLLCR